MRYNVYYGRLVAITDTCEYEVNIETLEELSEVVSKMLSCKVEITRTENEFNVTSDNNDLRWEVDTKYNYLLITVDGNDTVRNSETENHLEFVYKEEIDLDEEQIELIKEGKEDEILGHYYEWVESIDIENGTAIVGRFANEVCVRYYED